MEKVYKVRPHRVLVNLLFGVGAAIVVWLLSGVWLEEPMTYVAGGGLFVLYCLLVLGGNFISIHLSGNTLTVQKRGKVIHSFQIDQCSFRSYTKSSGGDTECNLYVTTPDGSETHIDCELIGVTKFHQLLDDLGVTGEKAPATRLNTTKK